MADAPGRYPSSASTQGYPGYHQPYQGYPHYGNRYSYRAADATKYKIAVMGRSGVGKSALTIRYVKNRFVPDYDPTIEDSYRKMLKIDGASTVVEILDTAGEEPYNVLRATWMREREGFIFVFSLIDRQTFEELSSFYDELMDTFAENPPPSVILANKADVEVSSWTVTPAETEELQASWKNCVQLLYTSALSNRNVSDGFEKLCHAIKEHQEACWAEQATMDAAVPSGVCSKMRSCSIL
jgi:small GTP-binding protein